LGQEILFQSEIGSTRHDLGGSWPLLGIVGGFGPLEWIDRPAAVGRDRIIRIIVALRIKRDPIGRKTVEQKMWLHRLRRFRESCHKEGRVAEPREHGRYPIHDPIGADQPIEFVNQIESQANVID
jgi:hypothetical protein